jgi:hypothetical protein
VFVSGVSPTGTVNGINPTFTVPNTPATASVMVFRNGLLQQAGLDYTFSSSTITFSAVSIPQPGDTLQAAYWYFQPQQ